MILHLSRPLLRAPVIGHVPGVALRPFAGDEDIDRWLALRDKAFADQTPAVRPWRRADFAAEFLAKPWWSPEGMWFAESGSVVGSVTLAMRGGAHRQSPVIHWLMVAPEWRRRGVGRLLVRALEAACWQAGHRRIGLETHAAWTQANALYRALGYDGGDAHVRPRA